MLADKQLFSCRGANYSITLYSDRIIMKDTRWANSKSFELPVDRIRSVIVERKSVIPFATVTIVAAILTVFAKYNALWFLANFTAENSGKISTIGLLASIVCAIPTIFRALFVNVSITWDGQPATFRARLVPARLGRRLTERFQELTARSYVSENG